MRHQLGLAMFTALCVAAMWSQVMADECIGSVVNGRCYGSIMRDFNTPGGRPDDSFHQGGQGYHTSPRPGTVLEGSKLHNYYEPEVQPGRGLRWKDEDE